jgi:hypothetical protein
LSIHVSITSPRPVASDGDPREATRLVVDVASLSRLFLLEQVNEGVRVAILEVRRIEVARLVTDDVTCKIHHILREL